MNVVGISGLHNSAAFKKKMMPDLAARQYRIAQGFDSAAALVVNNNIVAAAAEERFSRQKATGAFPHKAIQFCLEREGLSSKEVDYVAHSFEYEPYQSFFYENDFTRRQFDEVYSLDLQKQYLDDFFPSSDLSKKIVAVPHHVAHAASTFYPSGFDESLIFIVDGLGERHGISIGVGRDGKMELIEQIPALHSLGILYGLVTYHLGFYFNLDEYKVMGLAPYGNPKRYFNRFMEFVSLKAGGTFTISLLYENQTIQEKETYEGSLRSLCDVFGAARVPESELTQDHMDIAAAIQAVLQVCLLHVLKHYRKETGMKKVCMAGGVALNCTANGVLKRSNLFEDCFIQPAAGDDGTAIGAALYVQKKHSKNPSASKMNMPYWGPDYSNETIREVIQNNHTGDSKYYESFDLLAIEVAQYIAEGKVIGWFQGRMEFGPRALGNRSILADPRNPIMQSHINKLIKQREEFRPFAPAVLSDQASEIFEIKEGDSSLFEYMLSVTSVRETYREKLPAITHVDGSARVQVVTEKHNARFWRLIAEFGKLAGISVILNTSFNVRGQPIVCTPQEAIETFFQADLDVLVLGDFLILNDGAGAAQ